MMLVNRVVWRFQRLMQHAASEQLRRSLSAKPRSVRPMPSLDSLSSAAVLMIVAHPDDEVIAGGVLLRKASRAGCICVSNGAPRHPSFALDAGFSNWLDYAHRREQEAKDAFALLGRELSPLKNLGVTDQEVVDHMTALARYLEPLMTDGFTHVVTHAYEGGHPDHDSVAFSVHAACALARRAGRSPPILVEAPLYSAFPGEYVFQEFPPQDDAGPLVSFELSPEEQALKRQMFARHATQSKALADFDVAREIFRLAPRYHFSASQHPGEVGFDLFKWPVTGRIWRSAAWRAMRELDLLDELA